MDVRGYRVSVAVDERHKVRNDGWMTSLTGLIATNRAFAAIAARVDADAAVRNEIWPTAGAMIDHLGNIQAWATQVVRAGVPADRTQYTRPARARARRMVPADE